MLIDPKSSALLIIDMQERLLPHIESGTDVLDQCLKLAGSASRLGVPVMATEHYPQGLGPTTDALRTNLGEASIGRKLHFSALKAQCLANLEGFDRQQIVLCGAETHVCVLQTAMDLKRAGKDVFVVADAVGSRRTLDRDLALNRLAASGIQIVSTEMVMFEWLVQAGTDSFRSILRQFIR